MKEAMYYRKLKDKKVQCILCPRKCIILNGKYGECGVRLNKDGKLFSVLYGKPCSANVDPIEKKPFYHFLPGSLSFSIATVGCNLHCKNCQNWEISQAKPGEIPHLELSPKEVVKNAISHGCESIAYTYTEPIVFYEYMLDTAKLAQKKNLKNVLVSNGFVNPGPLKKLCKYLDAANIDLKSMRDEFYRKICDAWLEPVLKSIKILCKEKIHVEITTLIIPGENDSKEEIEKIAKFISGVDKKIPWHISRFFPMYKMNDKKATPFDTLEKAEKIGKKYLRYVYIGNV